MAFMSLIVTLSESSPDRNLLAAHRSPCPSDAGSGAACDSPTLREDAGPDASFGIEREPDGGRSQRGTRTAHGGSTPESDQPRGKTTWWSACLNHAEPGL